MGVLKAVWLALDSDRSGRISAGEFGRFMRLSEHVLRDENGGGQHWRDRLVARNRAAAEQQRAERARRFHRDIVKEREGKPPASDADVMHLASLCAEKVTELAARSAATAAKIDAPHTHATWFDLFRRIDTDGRRERAASHSVGHLTC